MRNQEESIKRSNFFQLEQVQAKGNGEHIDIDNQIQEDIMLQLEKEELR